jgi:hypothetical protein
MRLFPRLTAATFDIVSKSTPHYNCLAWADGDSKRWWDPALQPKYYWPEGAPRTDTIEALVKAYEIEGYQLCADANTDRESGYAKIAIYGDDSGYTHAARLLPTGRWASKLGSWVDIEHDSLEGLVGDDYGSVVRTMKKQVAPAPAPPPQSPLASPE